MTSEQRTTGLLGEVIHYTDLNAKVNESNIDVKIPNDYTGHPVKIIIDKTKLKVEPIAKFISYHIPSYQGVIKIGNKSISFDDFYTLLQEQGGLSPVIPLVINLNPFKIEHFDDKPNCYNGPHVFYFNWNGVKCSITGNIYIRVHDLTENVARNTLNNIIEELLKKWVNILPVNNLFIYTPLRSLSGYSWNQYSSKTHRPMDTIYLNEKIKTNLIHQLDKFLNSSDLYDRYGITWKRVHLFYGPPGSGKTSTILALASIFNKHIAKITITPSMDSSDIELLFKNLPGNTFLLLEDVDSLFVNRNATTNVDFSTILNCMDGLTTRRGLVLFMTTNHIMELDKAFLRPGRVDMCLEFELPNEDQMRQALHILGAPWVHEHEAYLKSIKDKNVTIADIQKHLFECIQEDKPSILD